MSMVSTLYKSLCRDDDTRHFPAWRTVEETYGNAAAVDFKLIMSVVAPADAQKDFDSAAQLIQDLRKHLAPRLWQATWIEDPVLKNYRLLTIEAMSDMIYGSNANELAGLGQDQTRNLCMAVFRGERIDATKVDPTSKEFMHDVMFLAREREIPTPTEYDVIRARREVIQHAEALRAAFFIFRELIRYITDAVMLCNEPLTEELIKRTHRILCRDIELEYDPASEGQKTDYIGKYRKYEVSAADHEFIPWGKVPKSMKKLVKKFNERIKGSDRSRRIDPFFLAADICQDFVLIHPFFNGNGRMARLLLNAYLMRYAGIVAGMALPEERDEFMSIVRESNHDERKAKGLCSHFIVRQSLVQLRRLESTLRDFQIVI